MQLKTWMVLGRVSNLPTIWTNVLAAMVIAQTGLLMPGVLLDAEISAAPLWTNAGMENVGLFLSTLFALSLMYVGGMFLNDASDVQWDRAHGNLRPIVNGDVSVNTVFLLGSVFLVTAIVIITYLYQQVLSVSNDATLAYEPYYGFIASVALALSVVLYNVMHKKFLYISAFIMGACRLGVYIIAALLLARLTVLVILAGASLLFYIAGLTYLARNEHQEKSNNENNSIARYWPLLLLLMPVLVSTWVGYSSVYFWVFLLIFILWIYRWVKPLLWQKNPEVGVCIGGLLAAIPLIDGLMLASVQAVVPAMICLLVFLLMPTLHRWVSGT